jgi:hypothetical protein
MYILIYHNDYTYRTWGVAVKITFALLVKRVLNYHPGSHPVSLIPQVSLDSDVIQVRVD